MTLERESEWKKERKRDGGGERGREAPRCAFFFFFISGASYYLCALQSRAWLMGEQLFMRRSVQMHLPHSFKCCLFSFLLWHNNDIKCENIRLNIHQKDYSIRYLCIRNGW